MEEDKPVNMREFKTMLDEATTAGPDELTKLVRKYPYPTTLMIESKTIQINELATILARVISEYKERDAAEKS